MRALKSLYPDEVNARQKRTLRRRNYFSKVNIITISAAADVF
jgi:hypothetical protein